MRDIIVASYNIHNKTEHLLESILNIPCVEEYVKFENQIIKANYLTRVHKQ